MAAVYSSHGTLTASAVTTVDLVDGQFPITVTNRGVTDIYVRFDAVDPAVGGDNSFLVAAGRIRIFDLRGPLNTADRTVRLISAGTPSYSVESA